MTGNDLEIGIRTAPIEAEIQEAGEVAIEARIFNEIVRRLNGESVTIATDEDYAVTIVSGSSEFKIMGQSGEDFPTCRRWNRKSCILWSRQSCAT